ncbi:MAG: beta-ketoacyl synthase N-terminal-like domain-containing protein, partial [Planctomycetota bacterium]
MNVVVTGIGAVSPVGMSADELWNAVAAGRDGFRPVTRFPTEGYHSSVAGEIAVPPPGNPRDWIFAFAKQACREALDDAGLEIDDRTGVALGSTLGAKDYADAFVRGELRPTELPPHPSVYHCVARTLADTFSVPGPCLTFDVACSSSLHAIGWGTEMIRHGLLDAVIAG